MLTSILDGVEKWLSVTPSLMAISDSSREEILERFLRNPDEEEQIEVRLRSQRRRRAKRWGVTGALCGAAAVLIPASIDAYQSGTGTWPMLGHVGLELLTHMGVGLIVAAIAVIGYEWGSDTQFAMKLSLRLQQLLVASGRDAVSRGLSELLRKDATVLQPFMGFLDAVTVMRDSSSWGKTAYLTFVQSLAQITRDMATSVSRLSLERSQERRHLPYPVSLKLPEPWDLADILLASLMKLLIKGDEYFAVSNVRIWPQLQIFLNEQEAAVARGISLRRIFVVFDESDHLLSPSDTTRIIYEHYQDTQKWDPPGGYRIKVVGRAAYQELAPKLASMLHFGVFRPRRHAAVAFEVKEHDLSSFEVTSVGPDSPYEIFDRLWNDLPEIDDSALRYMLRGEHMLHLANGGRYRAISSLESWTDHKLATFHNITLERLRHATISVKRILLFSTGDDLERARNLLSRHARDSSSSMLGQYHWKFYAGLPDSPPLDAVLTDKVPFGIFDDGETSFGQTVSELYLAHGPFLYERAVAMTVSDRFDELWDEIDNKRELLKRFNEAFVAELIAHD